LKAPLGILESHELPEKTGQFTTTAKRIDIVEVTSSSLVPPIRKRRKDKTLRRFFVPGPLEHHRTMPSLEVAPILMLALSRRIEAAQ
jgi:hypothetical protein